jgi:hypothetical protein
MVVCMIGLHAFCTTCRTTYVILIPTRICVGIYVGCVDIQVNSTQPTYIKTREKPTDHRGDLHKNDIEKCGRHLKRNKYRAAGYSFPLAIRLASR